MIQKSFSMKINKEIIAGTIFSKDNINIPPQFVFLHGAGSGVKERVLSIAAPIINHHINILAFDFSGHGESSGELKKGCLEKRVHEAKLVMHQFCLEEKPLIICGSRMGGFIAIKLLEFFKISTLILLCPALYTKKAYAIPFDSGFTEVIRSPESWKQTDVFPLLKNFTGRILIVMGGKDEVIPPGVIELIDFHTPKAKQKELYVISNCPHSITTWIYDRESEQKKLHQKILDFI